MAKRKDKLRGLVVLTGGIIVAGLLFWQWGIIPLGGYEVLLVLCFPIFAITLFLWWMAREHDEDIPFIGY